MKKGSLFFILSFFIFFISCGGEKIPTVPQIDSTPVCYEREINPNWPTVDISDSIRISYSPEISDLKVCTMCVYTSFTSDSLEAYFRFEYCDDRVILDFGPIPCILSLYNSRDIIPINLPDTIDPNAFEIDRYIGNHVFRNVIKFCDKGETVGALFYTNTAPYPKKHRFQGKLYFTKVSDPDHLYYMGYIDSSLEGLDHILQMLSTIRLI